MKNYKIILRNVGFVLIIVGLIDIGVMIYCVANGKYYSSSFNIFAVIGGGFLIKGNLKAARIIAQFAAFFLAGFAGVLAIVPIILPFDLILTYFKIEPASSSFVAIVFLVIMAMLMWTYSKLTSAPISAAMDNAKVNYTSFWRKPVRGFLFGGCLAVLFFPLVLFLMNGQAANEAKRRAVVQVGPTYKIAVTSIKIYGKHVDAIVTAYNDKEIRDIKIQW